mmetsp:Transcript_57096/g.133119  ORF Transcript_57096/g.133119 Transcript_57096/m.133119 type:complete len:111 (+) Transcript_57096:447-779(+)
MAEHVLAFQSRASELKRELQRQAEEGGLGALLGKEALVRGQKYRLWRSTTNYYVKAVVSKVDLERITVAHPQAGEQSYPRCDLLVILLDLEECWDFTFEIRCLRKKKNDA